MILDILLAYICSYPCFRRLKLAQNLLLVYIYFSYMDIKSLYVNLGDPSLLKVYGNAKLSTISYLINCIEFENGVNLQHNHDCQRSKF
jgi:hypothetical protein